MLRSCLRAVVPAATALAVALPALAVPASAADAAPTTLRVGTGTTAVRDAGGNVWSAARGFTGGYTKQLRRARILGTRSASVYATQRVGVTRFSRPVADGAYRVTLLTTETFWGRAGQRVFDVDAEGVRAAAAVDIARAVGRGAAYTVSFDTTVTDGSLDLVFRVRRDQATVSGVSALRTGPGGRTAKPATTPVPVVEPTAAPTTAPVAVPDHATGTVPVVEATPDAVAVRPTPTWASGASGQQVPDGSFGAWRGRPVDIAGSWVDNNEAQVKVWSLQPTGEYADWTKDLDLAVGAIGWDETWAAAAQGAYEARWRQSLLKIKELWERHDRGQLYLRFAHEMNGGWYPWHVTDKDVTTFPAAWKRYRALQQEILPQAKLVFSVNRESVGSMVDWRKTFPGKQYVDVLAVDYYNHWPASHSQAEWDAQLWQTDQWGGPKGLAAHQAFAKSQGLPFAVSEWGNNVEFGESPFYMHAMHDFFAANAGSGPGQVLYEIYFAPDKAEDGKWGLWPSTRQPLSAEAYREAF